MLPLLLLFAGHLLLISRDIKNVTAHSGTLWYNPDRHCFVPLRLSFSGTVAFFSLQVSLAMAIFNHTHTRTRTPTYTGQGLASGALLFFVQTRKRIQLIPATAGFFLRTYSHPLYAKKRHYSNERVLLRVFFFLPFCTSGSEIEPPQTKNVVTSAAAQCFTNSKPSGAKNTHKTFITINHIHCTNTHTDTHILARISKKEQQNERDTQPTSYTNGPGEKRTRKPARTGAIEMAHIKLWYTCQMLHAVVARGNPRFTKTKRASVAHPTHRNETKATLWPLHIKTAATVPTIPRL